MECCNCQIFLFNLSVVLHLHLFQFLLQHLDVIVALDKLCPLIHVLVLPFDIRPDGIDTKLNSEVCDSKVDKTLWDKI